MKTSLLITRLLAFCILVIIGFSLTSNPSEARQGPPRQQGTFRVTLNGFHVFQETKDTAFHADGRFDEIQLLATSFLVESDPLRIVGGDYYRSFVMCDGTFLDPNRLGIFKLLSGRGFKAGDDFPAGSPWQISIPPSKLAKNSSTPPVILFNGVLIQARRAVVIIPSIWEIDGPGNLHPNYETMLNVFASARGGDSPFLSSVGPMLHSPQTSDERDVRSALREGDLMGLGLMVENVTLGRGILGLGDPKDRPIGMVKRDDRYGFVPKALVLTFATADAIARSRGPYGAGVVKVYYADDPDLQGQYELYLQVERLGN